MAKVIAIATREASIKRRLRRHLTKLGFHKNTDGLLEIAGSGKDVIRSLHGSQRSDPECEIFGMHNPLAATASSPTEILAGISLEAPGALVVARHGEHQDALIVSDGLARDGLRGLGVRPDASDVASGHVSLESAIRTLGLWLDARPRSLAPVLSIRQRPISKGIEEPIYGCDIAWLMTGTVGGRFDATWVDLVQVKKSSALQQQAKKVTRSDSWRIDSKQLDTILKWSSTSIYWMIASAGEILVIPAKHLSAVRRGTEKHVGRNTFTVGYHEVRSVAIPLEQYLVDLLMGQWLGTSSDDVVQFALGEGTGIRPRAVIEVRISVGEEQNH